MNIHVQALATLRFDGLDVSIACYNRESFGD